jgi:hypothetical protein
MNMSEAASKTQFLTNVVKLRPGSMGAEICDISPDAETMALIRSLRRLLQGAFLQPRDALDHACILIAAEPSVSAERHAAAFFHGLEAFARRRLRFYTSKAGMASVDEMWLARLIRALQTGDSVNARYLLALRVEPAGRRRLLFLAQGLADALLEQDSAGALPGP